MLRTNSKVVNEKVKDYVLECLSTEQAYIDDGMNGIMEWYAGWNVSLGEFLVNYSNTFTPYYNEQRELLKTWLEQTDEIANKYDDEKVNRLFISLINRALNKLRGVK